ARAPSYKKLAKEWLASAVARGQLHVHKAAGKSKKKYGREPDVVGLLRATLQALKKALSTREGAQIPRERIAEVLLGELGVASATLTSRASSGVSLASGTSHNEELLGALRVLQAQTPGQALLSVGDLRARLALSKEQFDKAALQLADDGTVSL